MKIVTETLFDHLLETRLILRDMLNGHIPDQERMDAWREMDEELVKNKGV